MDRRARRSPVGQSEGGLKLLSADQLARILEESDLGIVVTELDGTILTASPAIVKMTGYSMSELIGASPSKFKGGHTPSPVYAGLWSTIKSGQTWKGALLNRRKDGTFYLDRETITAGVSVRGNKPCFVAVHRAAEAEMDLRLKLQHAEKQLDLQLGEIEEAKSKMKMLVEMTSQQAEGVSHALVASLEARDPNTAGHGARTAVLMDLIGKELGLFERVPQEEIRLGAILHDIGKIGIPDGILLKDGPLTDSEYEIIKTHPAVGFEILSHVGGHEEALRIVRHHHERLDGSGYPDRLCADEIPDYVQAFSVCDCFDAMTSRRSYRNPISAEDAISYLTDDALCGRLHMSAVKALKKLFTSGMLGVVRELSLAA